MKRMPFERPTDHYDERIFPIDKQICELLNNAKIFRAIIQVTRSLSILRSGQFPLSSMRII